MDAWGSDVNQLRLTQWAACPFSHIMGWLRCFTGGGRAQWGFLILASSCMEEDFISCGFECYVKNKPITSIPSQDLPYDNGNNSFNLEQNFAMGWLLLEVFLSPSWCAPGFMPVLELVCIVSAFTSNFFLFKLLFLAAYQHKAITLYLQVIIL